MWAGDTDDMEGGFMIKGMHRYSISTELAID